MYRGKVSEEGTIYIISAGAGAPLYPLNEEDKRFLYAESCYNYVLVKVGGDTLTLKAKYPDGEAFDSLALKKTETVKYRH